MRFWGWLSLLLVCSGLVNFLTSPRETTNPSSTIHPPDLQENDYPLPNQLFNINNWIFERQFPSYLTTHYPTSTHSEMRISEVTVIAVAPTCYDAPNYRVLCLGFVKNPLEQTVEQVVLRVNLLDGLGNIRKTQLIYPEQRYILPGQSAPYRVFFENVTESQAIVDVEIQHVKSASNETPSLNLLTESANLQFAERSYGRYQIEGYMKNADVRQRSEVRVIATLYDAHQRVTGYRAMNLGAVLPDEVIPFHIEVIPQIIQTDFHHTLHVEVR